MSSLIGGTPGIGGSGGTAGAQSAFANPQILSALLPNYNLSALDSAMQAQLTAAEQPLANLSQQLSTLQSQIAAWQGLQSDLSKLSTDAQSLAGTTLYGGVSATTTAPNSVQVSQAGSGTGVPGTYLVGVSQLMQTEIDNSAAQTSATVGLGDSGSFTINGQTVTVAASDSLQAVAASINAAGAGVTATVLPSSGEYVLNLASTGGAAITWTDASGILQGLGVLNTSLTPAHQLQAARPTLYTVNGVSEQSTTDGDSSSIPGVQLTFTGTTSSPATVAVTQNTGAITGTFQQLASDYNALLKDVNAYAGPGGVLEGNATVLGLSDTLQQVLGGWNAALPNGYQSLSQLGVTISAPVGSPNQLSMAVNSSTLQSALTKNPADVQQLLSAAGSGIATQLSQQLDTFVGATGSLPSEISSLQSQQSSLSTEINDPNSSINLIVSSQEQNLQTAFQNMLQALVASQNQGAQIQGFLSQQYGQTGSGSSHG